MDLKERKTRRKKENTEEGAINHPVDMFVGAKLRYLRRCLGMSQDVLARLVGLTFQQIQKYEKGLNRISCSKLYEFAKILGVSIEDFFDGFAEYSSEMDFGNQYYLADSSPPPAYDSGPLNATYMAESEHSSLADPASFNNFNFANSAINSTNSSTTSEVQDKITKIVASKALSDAKRFFRPSYSPPTKNPLFSDNSNSDLSSAYGNIDIAEEDLKDFDEIVQSLINNPQERALATKKLENMLNIIKSMDDMKDDK